MQWMMLFAYLHLLCCDTLHDVLRPRTFPPFLVLGCDIKFIVIFGDVTTWYQSLGLSELEKYSCESSLKLRKKVFINDFQSKGFKNNFQSCFQNNQKRIRCIRPVESIK